MPPLDCVSHIHLKPRNRSSMQHELRYTCVVKDLPPTFRNELLQQSKANPRIQFPIERETYGCVISLIVCTYASTLKLSLAMTIQLLHLPHSIRSPASLVSISINHGICTTCIGPYHSVTMSCICPFNSLTHVLYQSESTLEHSLCP